MPRTLLLAFAALLVGFVATGCGGGEVASGEVPGSPPALTVRSDSEIGAAGADADAASGADADADASGTPTPEPTVTVDPSSGTTTPESTTAPEDTTAEPEQPAAGSEPEQFESFCEQNAGAC